MRVSVIGGSDVDRETAEAAEAVGRRLAEGGHELVCGGLGGVMAAACRGAADAGGRTIGILPGRDRTDANPHVDTAIATGLGDARNALVVLNGDAVIAIDGGPGTLSELGLALVYGRPVAGLDTFEVEGVEAVASPAAAVDHLESAGGTASNGRAGPTAD
ncbi:MAG: TIGR00725 family protein [Halobacteriales archaeon]